MHRRDFLQKSAAASLSFSLLPSAFLKQDNAYINKIGLQLYTVRNQMAKDPAATLKAIKEAGYYQVEGGNPFEYDRLMPLIKDAGLVSQSTFFPNQVITERWDLIGGKPATGSTMQEMVDKAEQHGMKYVVFGYLSKAERETIDAYKTYAERLNRAGELCNKAGITLCYHNHSFEFEPIKGEVPYEVLIKELDPQNARFELDIFWASIGGYDPVKLMKRMDGQITLLHLKDKLKGVADEYDEGQVPKDAFQELGDGVINIRKVLEIAPAIGVEECFVEQDQSPDPLSSIAQSRNYLRKLEGKI
ncbi:MAG: sugar phosphate isomerase/epimerase family protein [Cyclobacteriaceae bacterium]